MLAGWNEERISVSKMIDGYKRGLLTKPEFFELMEAHQITKEMAEFLIKLTEKQPSAAQIIRTYRIGLISAEEVTAELKSLGYSNKAIYYLTTTPEQLPSETKIRTLWKLKGITENDVENYYLAQGYTEEWASTLKDLLCYHDQIEQIMDLQERWKKLYLEGKAEAIIVTRQLAALGMEEEEIKDFIEMSTDLVKQVRGEKVGV